MKTGRITLKLVATLRALEEEGNVKTAKHILEGVKHYYQQFLKIKGTERAKAAMLAIDQQIESINPERKKDISCKKGCAFCCMIGVSITKNEGDHLKNVIKEKGIEIDKELQALQIKAVEGLNDEQLKDAWDTLPYEKRRCLLLSKENTCMVYEDRPVICRDYLVVSESRICDSQVPSDRVEVVNIPHAQMVLSGFLQAEKEMGPLPRMILE